MKKFAFAVIAALTLTLTLKAQSNKESYRLRDIQHNGIADNWFGTVGAGFNGVIDNGSVTFQGLAVEAVVGKWLTPVVGLRAGWHGVDNKNLADDWLYGNHRFSYNYLHADALFRLTNIGRYKPARLVNVDLYAGAGAILTRYLVTNWEFAGGIGTVLDFHVWGPLHAFADASVTFSKSGAWRTDGNVIAFPSLTAGLTADFGRRTRWMPKEQAQTVYVPVPGEPDRSRERALQAQVDSLLAASSVTQTDTTTITEIPPQIVYFDLDKAVLSDREKAHLEYFSMNLPAGTSCKITLYGSADKPTGNPRHNLDLSKRRCKAVQDYLAEIADFDSVVCVPEGDTNNRFETQPKNRCVFVEVPIQ